MRYILIFFLLFSNPIAAQWVQLNTDTLHEYYCIDFINSDTGFVAGVDWNFGLPGGYDGVVLRTLDGGDTWDTTRIWGVGIYFIDFLNDSVGICGGKDGNLLWTTDMGNNWTYIGNCQQNLDISSFHFFNTDSALIHRRTGSILKFYNNNPITCPILFNSDCHSNGSPIDGSMNFTSPTNAYIAGGFGKFYKTTDAGLTWSPNHADSSLIVSGATHISNDTIIMYGRYGMITTTINGGTTWSQPTSIDSKHIFDISFYNEQKGYAVGGDFTGYPPHKYKNGTIWETSDGGQSWSVVDSSYTSQLNSILIVNDSLAFAIGFYGQLLRNQTHFTTLNVNNPASKGTITIFPNPVSGNSISFNNLPYSDYEIQVFNSIGKLVYSTSYKSSVLTLPDLEKGVYFIKVNDKLHSYTQKLILQ